MMIFFGIASTIVLALASSWPSSGLRSLDGLASIQQAELSLNYQPQQHYHQTRFSSSRPSQFSGSAPSTSQLASNNGGQAPANSSSSSSSRNSLILPANNQFETNIFQPISYSPRPLSSYEQQRLLSRFSAQHPISGAINQTNRDSVQEQLVPGAKRQVMSSSGDLEGNGLPRLAPAASLNAEGESGLLANWMGAPQAAAQSSPAEVTPSLFVSSADSRVAEGQEELTRRSTTEQSNNIAQPVDGGLVSGLQHRLHLSQVQNGAQADGNAKRGADQASSGRTDLQAQAQPQAQQQQQSVVLADNQSSSSMEFNNQVIYEGPATAPPASDYYFTSAERLAPGGPDIISNAWWALGIGHEFERASNLTSDDYLDYCASSELMVSNKQRSLCRSHPRIMPIVARGIKMAIDECQSRFVDSRWNCSLVLKESLEPVLTSQGPQIFGEVMKQRLAHAMTKACSQGELPEECSCDKRIRSKSHRNKIEWIACSDDIDFGARFSRAFTDNSDNEPDAVAMINAHNYEVGRRVFKSSTDITCNCQNGDNGSCQTKRCWKHLGPFADIGDELIRRYESATHVQASHRDPHKLRPVRRGVRRPKRKDLVYIDESPDYCIANTRLGILGTQNRHCNSTSLGSDSCSLLCCGRGYQVVVEEVEEDCKCKFVWCCQLKCDRCKRHITSDICN